jgi:predicted small lipoprotein YifL
MQVLRQVVKRPLWLWAGVVVVLLAGCGKKGSSEMSPGGAGTVTLTGAQEVPPLPTSGSGKGTITVSADRTVTGSVTTTGVPGTAAHIHMAAPGQNGPVIIPLVKSGDNVWTVPAGAKLTDAQYEAYKAGNLYVNVHTEVNKGGEIRGQLKP